MVSNLVTITTNYFVSKNWFIFDDFLVVIFKSKDWTSAWLLVCE